MEKNAVKTKAGAVPTIIQALDAADLFQPHFRGDTWKPWRAFLKALFALPMEEDDLALYRAHTGRQTAPTEAFTEADLIIGRRGGKSRIMATIAVYLACLRDYDPYLAPGEIATIGIAAATRPQARSIFRYVSGLLNGVPALAGLKDREDADTIVLKNRVQIEIGVASFRVTRGYTYGAFLADEIAFWRDETSANPDVEILRAIRPGLATIPGSILLKASSPYAKKGVLYQSFRRNFGKDSARTLVWKAPTLAMYSNPRLAEERAKDFEEDPEAASAEWDAEFRNDLADWIAREQVDAVTAWGCRERQPDPGVAYSAFCDPSGGGQDLFTLAIGHLRDGSVGVLDAILEIRPPFDPDVAIEQCAALLDRFGIKRLTGDHYAGQFPVSRFAAHGITFEQSAKPKSDIYRDALPLFNSRRVELLEHPRLSAQLCALAACRS